jgi:hypothetical protein
MMPQDFQSYVSFTRITEDGWDLNKNNIKNIPYSVLLDYNFLELLSLFPQAMPPAATSVALFSKPHSGSEIFGDSMDS